MAGQKTKRHRISTTISSKHWEILKKHAKELETQQKVLEVALEKIESESSQEQISPKEYLWMRTGREMGSAISIIHKSLFEELIDTADCERLLKIYAKLKPAEFLVVWYYQRPLKKCTLKEVIEGIIATTKMGNWFESLNCRDNGNYYTLEVNHVLKMKGSKLFNKFFEDLFRAYGVETVSEMSETGFFIKINNNIK